MKLLRNDEKLDNLDSNVFIKIQTLESYKV